MAKTAKAKTEPKKLTIYRVWDNHGVLEVMAAEAVEKPKYFYVESRPDWLEYRTNVAKDDKSIGLSPQEAIEREHARLTKKIKELETERVKAQEAQIKLNVLRVKVQE